MISPNPRPWSASDFMQLALWEARQNLGQTWPNPSVGCVLVDPATGQVVARGATQKTGRPHAEVVALNAISGEARGLTAYVSFEPCSHHGVTPPCSQALIEAGVTRVVIACLDPHPKVNGSGIAQLQQAGLSVTVGTCATEAERLNAGFISVQKRGRPWVTLKLATSLDGKLALANGKSRWITGEAARRYTHNLRAQYDAILVGSGTVLADNPDLTCRLGGQAHRSPVRVILDRTGRLTADVRLVRSAKTVPTWVVTTNEKSHKLRALEAHGVKLCVSADSSPQPTIGDALKILAHEGLTRILCEGGRHVATALWQEDAVDELVWIHAPKILGEDARVSIGELGLNQLESAGRKLQCTERVVLGEDGLAFYTIIRE